MYFFRRKEVDFSAQRVSDKERGKKIKNGIAIRRFNTRASGCDIEGLDLWLYSLGSFGSGSEHQNKSAKNIEMRALKYSPRGPTTEVPKIQKCQKDKVFQMFYSRKKFFHVEKGSDK